MAETVVRATNGWRLCPGSECTGNTFSKLLVTNCGGKAFLVNDAGCVHNTISDGRFLNNTQGGLFQAAANLVTVRSSDKQTKPGLPAQVAFIK